MNWISIDERRPDKSHEKKRTQFLIKGSFQIGNKSSKVIYRVERLNECIPDDWEDTFFESPMDFKITHWCFID